MYKTKVTDTNVPVTFVFICSRITARQLPGRQRPEDLPDLR